MIRNIASIRNIVNVVVTLFILLYAMCLYVKGKDAETVRRWKDFEKSLGISGTDSAFGSDLE